MRLPVPIAAFFLLIFLSPFSCAPSSSAESKDPHASVTSGPGEPSGELPLTDFKVELMQGHIFILNSFPKAKLQDIEMPINHSVTPPTLSFLEMSYWLPGDRILFAEKIYRPPAEPWQYGELDPGPLKTLFDFSFLNRLPIEDAWQIASEARPKALWDSIYIYPDPKKRYPTYRFYAFDRGTNPYALCHIDVETKSSKCQDEPPPQGGIAGNNSMDASTHIANYTLPRTDPHVDAVMRKRT